jgi:hypothetical protein
VNIWTATLEQLRAKPLPEARARRAFAAELHAAPSSSEAYGVSAEAWTLAVGMALEPMTAAAIVSRLGMQRAVAVTAWARATGLDPMALAGLANAVAGR